MINEGGDCTASADLGELVNLMAQKYKVILDINRICGDFAKSEGFTIPDHAFEGYMAQLGFTPTPDGAWIAEAKSLACMGDVIISQTAIE